MKNIKFIVKTKSKSYPIYFGNGILNTTGSLIKKNLVGVKKICIISDNKLPKLLLKKLIKSLKRYDLKIFKLSTNEKTKSLNVANKIIINKLYEERKNIYKLANYRIDCAKLSKKNIANKIIISYEKH